MDEGCQVQWIKEWLLGCLRRAMRMRTRRSWWLCRWGRRTPATGRGALPSSGVYAVARLLHLENQISGLGWVYVCTWVVRGCACVYVCACVGAHFYVQMRGWMHAHACVCATMINYVQVQTHAVLPLLVNIFWLVNKCQAKGEGEGEGEGTVSVRVRACACVRMCAHCTKMCAGVLLCLQGGLGAMLGGPSLKTCTVVGSDSGGGFV